jgi:hypothetical protein
VFRVFPVEYITDTGLRRAGLLVLTWCPLWLPASGLTALGLPPDRLSTSLWLASLWLPTGWLPTSLWLPALRLAALGLTALWLAAGRLTALRLASLWLSALSTLVCLTVTLIRHHQWCWSDSIKN